MWFTVSPNKISILILASSLQKSVAAVLATPSGYNPPAPACTNSPKNRGCWSEGFDINTDYYKSWPDTGVIREYWLSVENTTVAPDGTQVGGAITFNGTIPGPTLYMDWGDRIRIHVTNNLQHNATNIHWHGLRQLHTNPADGIGGVTQCPIAPGQKYTYEWRATEYGTSWYHSHYTVQYGAGLQGPVQINGPATMNYDHDLGVMMVQDWVHKPNVFEALSGIAFTGNGIVMNTGLLNGTNVTPCDAATETCVGDGSYWNATVKKGKSYRLRLASGAVQAHFRITIDNHKFHMIANDFVPVVPYETTSFVIAQGQRYDIVFKADQAIGNYWIRALWQNCSFETVQHPRHTLGIIRYEGASTTEDPTTKNRLTAWRYNQCGNKDFYDHLTPHLALDVGPVVRYGQFDLSATLSLNYSFLWTVNGSSFLTDWDRPVVKQLAAGEFGPDPFFADGDYTNRTNQSLIDAGYRLPLPYNGTEFTAQNIFAIPEGNSSWVILYWNAVTATGDYHPMHLHGHDYWIISQEANVPWYPWNSTANYKNPPRRDVATLPNGGHLAVAIQSDNPGIWLFHCHIAWHVSAGLGMQILEQPGNILGFYDMNYVDEVCSSYQEYVDSPSRITGQDDSGI